MIQFCEYSEFVFIYLDNSSLFGSLLMMFKGLKSLKLSYIRISHKETCALKHLTGSQMKP